MKIIYFTLCLLFSLFSYSSEPLDSLDGKSLFCKESGGYTIHSDGSVTEGNSVNKPIKNHTPSQYLGLKFIKNTVSTDKLIKGNLELNRKIVQISSVETYKVTWCNEWSPVWSSKHNAEVTECINYSELDRTTLVTHTYFRPILYEASETSSGLPAYRSYKFDGSYLCELQNNFTAYENILSALPILESRRLEAIENEKLERLKKRKL